MSDVFIPLWFISSFKKQLCFKVDSDQSKPPVKDFVDPLSDQVKAQRGRAWTLCCGEILVFLLQSSSDALPVGDSLVSRQGSPVGTLTSLWLRNNLRVSVSWYFSVTSFFTFSRNSSDGSYHRPSFLHTSMILAPLIPLLLVHLIGPLQAD